MRLKVLHVKTCSSHFTKKRAAQKYENYQEEENATQALQSPEKQF